MTKTEMKAIAGSGGGWRKVRRSSMALFVKSGMENILMGDIYSTLTVDNDAHRFESCVVLPGLEK